MLQQNVDTASELHTDEARHYPKAARDFAEHLTVNHSIQEYARGNVTTNTVEGYFSIFKRGMRGICHHCSEQHLQRYLHEFDFRYSHRSAVGIEDAERTAIRDQRGRGQAPHLSADWSVNTRAKSASPSSKCVR